MAPRFRTRIATGLLVVAAVLPVPVAAATAAAADQRSAPVDRKQRADEDHKHSGRPGSPHGPRVPDADALLDLSGLTAFPDIPGFPERTVRLPDELTGHAPRHGHSWHPSGRDAEADFPSSSGPAWGGLPPAESRPRHHGPSAPAAEPGGSAAPGSGDSRDSGDDAATAGPRPHKAPPKAPVPSGAPSARKSPSPTAPAPAVPPKPTPSHRSSAGESGQRTSEEAAEDASGTSEERTDSAQDAAEAAPTTETPYSLDAPAARVERVLPMGAGLALTGLGLAFLGLRLRRG